MKARLTKDQKKALERYNFALREEDRFMGSVFASSAGQRRVEEKTRLAELLILQGWRVSCMTHYGMKFYKIYLK